MRAAGLGASTGQTFAAEGLDAHHGAYLVAVHIHVADLHAGAHLIDRRLDAGVEAEGQAETRRIDRIADFAETIAGKAHDVQDGAEDLALQCRDCGDLIGRW